jgi:hypothetical protein
MHHLTGSAVAAIFFSVLANSGAQAQDKGPELAQETVKLIRLQKDMIVNAVRQKHSRRGMDDFDKFIVAPVEVLSKRWGNLPRSVQSEFLACKTALNEHEWHMRDSFKAGEILKASSLIDETLAQCAKDAKPVMGKK